MIISLDCEATGLDLAHGAMPYLVTTCDDAGEVRYWEWDVNPVTRRPEVPEGDLADIAELLDAAELVYLQNAKYDARALATVGIALPWDKVCDTIVMGHLLASNHPHNLTWMCVEYLGVDIQHFEDDVEVCTRLARQIAKRDFPGWKIAQEGGEGMPSVKGYSKRDEDKPWKNDMWLPRALIKAGVTQYVPEHWSHVTADYANADSSHTLPLGQEMEKLIKDRGLYLIYLERLKLVRIACEMETYGVTAIGEYAEATIAEYQRYTAEAGEGLRAIASACGHDLELAEGAAINDNMRDFFYGAVRQNCPHCNYENRVKHWNGECLTTEPCPKCLARKKGPARNQLVTTTARNLGLPVILGKKTRNATLDKDAMKEYLGTLEGDALEFIKLLTDKRNHDTDLGYMESYRRFWVPVINHRSGCVHCGYVSEGGSTCENCGGDTGGFCCVCGSRCSIVDNPCPSCEHPEFYRIHPSLNPCGTDHLRWSSNSPNLHNVGKQEDADRVSVRNCFGPAKGREWWSMDFKSIENRIPPYECGEEKAIEVFEKPDSAPYWGSLYYLTASVLYPDRFWDLAEFSPDDDRGFKKAQARLYKQAKFFNLARQYGCGRAKGDALSKVKNSFDKVNNEFPKLAKLQAHYLRFAEKNGFVETLPDKSVDPTRGYPILASRTEDGRVLSTTPFNYHVSGTACWCKNRALVRCAAHCAQWRAEGFDANISLEIHDEIIFDFPRGAGPEENRERAMVLKKLMEQSGEDLIPRIPTPVSVEYHATTWAKGVAV